MSKRNRRYLIHDLVIKADQTSVERDLKTMGVAMAGYDLGVPVERHLTDIMRRLVREGVWFINEPGARLWNIAGHIYLVWPAGGEDVAKQVREDGVPGIPRTPDGILDMLVERQIAYVREGALPGDRLWKIAPAILAEKIPDIKLKAIRLRDDSLVSAVPIPPVEGKIVNDVDGGQSVPTLKHPQAQETQSETPVAEQSDPHDAAPKPDVTDNVSQPVAPIPKPPPSTQITSVVDRDLRAESSPMSEEVTFRPAPAKADPAIVVDGAIGEALKALAQDIQTGDKAWGRDAMVDPEVQVWLKWPDAFAGYGLTAKSILDDLHGREWLWIDPMTPLKKVQDAEFQVGVAKAIRLEPAISQWLIREAGWLGRARNDSAGKEETVRQPVQDTIDPDQVVASPVETAEKPVRKTRRKTPPQAVPPKAEEPADVTPAESEGIVKQAPVVVVEASGGTITVEDVIAVIKQLPAQTQLDGYYAVPKADVMTACKKAGLKLTHKRLADLCQQEPERLHADVDVIRYKV